jgi:hypothetical protein
MDMDFTISPATIARLLYAKNYALRANMIGNFKNSGRLWGKEAERVNGHDFPSQSDGRAVPYGIYDVSRNCGTVCVGKSADTPEFAVDAIEHWWLTDGKLAYPDKNCSYWPMQVAAMVHVQGCGKNSYRNVWLTSWD